MSDRVRKSIYIVCMTFFFSIVFLNEGSCFSNHNAIEMNQDVRWISLDLPPEQRMLIDEILKEEYKNIRLMQRHQEIMDISNMSDLAKLSNYMKMMNEVESKLSDEIIKILPFEQRSIFEDQLERQKDLTEKTTATLLGLNLTKVQQTMIINILIESKKDGWAIITNTSLSWEQRRNQLRRKNVTEKITALLNPYQLMTWASWNSMMTQ